MRDLRTGLLFFEMPAARWTARTEGRGTLEVLRLGSGMSLRDLSVSMEGDVARRAARECFEGPGTDLVSEEIHGRTR